MLVNARGYRESWLCQGRIAEQFILKSEINGYTQIVKKSIPNVLNFCYFKLKKYELYVNHIKIDFRVDSTLEKHKNVWNYSVNWTVLRRSQNYFP